MGHVVIVGYRPKPGQRDALLALTATHVPRLRAAGLATQRAPIVMEAADGTIIEVFEWIDRAAVERAHAHPDVQRMWAEYAAVCEYVPIGALSEAAELFSGFASVELAR